MECKTCHAEMMNNPNSLHHNCGGDCLWCMAKAGDPDCVEEVVNFMLSDCMSQMRAAVEEFAGEVEKLDYDIDLFYIRISENFRP